MTEGPAPDLSAAANAVTAAQAVVDAAARSVAARGGVDANQAIAYDLAHAAAGAAIAGAALDYGAKGDIEARLACAFVADMVVDLVTKVTGREAEWGTEPGWWLPAEAFVAACAGPTSSPDCAASRAPGT